MGRIRESLPVFEWKFNFGHVATALALFGTGSWFMSNQTARIDDLARRMRVVEDRGIVYVPRIEALIQANTLQDERIGNMSDAIRQMRSSASDQIAVQSKVNADILAKLGDIREDLATIKATIARDGVPLPRLQPTPR